ncbi:MAG: MotA/TolQ/ExbB proton channel family protein [Kiritimatiellae bacterium]|jgi:biopolymer transport protein ExbB/TolQ|nr:MotA/TolQ/ExbB proton channel family protein [Kiritimatiellia bacterium]
MGGFTFREMLLNSWPIISVLAIMSVISLTIILDRFSVLRRARLNAAALAANLLKITRSHGLPAALEYCRRFSQPAANVMAAVIMRGGGREAMERAGQHALQAEINRLETYVPILGTVGSTAPFIGLLGTVLGIIKSFQDIAIHSGGGPEVVSAGIAEALIATAFGLLVAIPAVMFYNYCVHKIQRMTQEIDLAAYEIIEELQRTGNTP